VLWVCGSDITVGAALADGRPIPLVYVWFAMQSGALARR
jgi:hypothetical protein